MRTPLRLIVLALTSVLAALALSTPASAAASPYCGITWGSLTNSAGTTASPSPDLTGIRAGQHTRRRPREKRNTRARHDRRGASQTEAGGSAAR